jgi:hypothetical protein
MEYKDSIGLVTRKFRVFMTKKHDLRGKKIRPSRAVLGVTQNLGHAYSLPLKSFNAEI